MAVRISLPIEQADGYPSFCGGQSIVYGLGALAILVNVVAQFCDRGEVGDAYLGTSVVAVALLGWASVLYAQRSRRPIPMSGSGVTVSPAVVGRYFLRMQVIASLVLFVIAVMQTFAQVGVPVRWYVLAVTWVALVVAFGLAMFAVRDAGSQGIVQGRGNLTFALCLAATAFLSLIVLALVPVEWRPWSAAVAAGLVTISPWALALSTADSSA